MVLIKKIAVRLLLVSLALLYSVELKAENFESKPAELKTLESKNFYESKKQNFKIEEIRYRALKETALTLSVQTAVKWKYERIISCLKGIEDELDRIFNFSFVLIENGKILPPVILEVQSGMKFESDELSVSSAVMYKIEKDAKLVSLAPNWREYLIKEFKVIEEVDPVLYPKNESEKKVWKKYTNQGWRIGVDQADDLFGYRLNELTRDLRGMVKFKILASQKIVSVPVLAEGKLGVQVNGKILDIDQRVFRLTQPVKFNEVKNWEPIVASTNQSP